jgi:hypothetical protein
MVALPLPDGTLRRAPAPTNRPARDGIAVVTAALMTVFVMELIVGGPGFWQVGGISIRRTLLAVVTLWMLGLAVVGHNRLRQGHVLMSAVVGFVLVTWMFVVPVAQDPGRLGDAVTEGLPLAMLFTGILVHAYYIDRPGDWLRLRRRCAVFLGVAASAAILIWVIGVFFVDDPLLVALAATAAFTWGNESLEPALYIQRMPDGFFRVMWITSVLYAIGLLYALRQRHWVGIALFGFALFVSYTRALWLAAAIGYLLARLTDSEFRPWSRLRWTHGLLALALLCAALFAELRRPAEESLLQSGMARIGSTFSDESAEDRYDQAGPLLDAWQTAPLMGLGLGSAAPGSVRSDVASYLYELTYLALLMKLGTVGVALLATITLALLWRRRRGARAVGHIDASLACFLLAAGTNPYLLNLIGIGVLCFLVTDRDVQLLASPGGAERR